MSPRTRLSPFVNFTRGFHFFENFVKKNTFLSSCVFGAIRRVKTERFLERVAQNQGRQGAFLGTAGGGLTQIDAF